MTTVKQNKVANPSKGSKTELLNQAIRQARKQIEANRRKAMLRMYEDRQAIRNFGGAK